jgi:hypothetical protein
MGLRSSSRPLPTKAGLALPPDPACYLQIKPFSTVTFSIQIREPALPQGKWSWKILSAKGLLRNDCF